MVAPSGGQKDETPAKVIRSFPTNKTTHFNAPKIIIQFDEYVVLNNPTEQIIISPPLETKPEFSVDRKKVIIDLKKQKLKENTTYTINFGNAVGDLHENNITGDLTYVFATGSVIDTNRLAGITLNAFNNQPEKGILVGLYDESGASDSMIFKQKPIYFSRTKGSGNFSIENIPDHKFKLVAFRDENSNLKYDAAEFIGFIDSSLNPVDTTNKLIRVNIFKPDIYQPGRLLDTFSNTNGEFMLVVYKSNNASFSDYSSPINYQWKETSKNEVDTISLFTASADTVLSFNYKNASDSGRINIKSRFKHKYRAFNIQVKKSPELNDTLIIHSGIPILKVDTSLIQLLVDSIRIRNFKYFYSIDGRQLQIIAPWEEGKKYTLTIPDSAIIDFYGRKPEIKTLKYAWNSKTIKDYSNLKLLLNKSTVAPIIFQLWNEQESSLIKEFYLRETSTISIDYLIPGTYKLKFIIDSNRNGIWDTGDYKQKTQPEKVIYYSENLVLRAYWDVEQSIDIIDMDK